MLAPRRVTLRVDPFAGTAVVRRRGGCRVSFVQSSLLAVIAPAPSGLKVALLHTGLSAWAAPTGLAVERQLILEYPIGPTCMVGVGRAAALEGETGLRALLAMDVLGHVVAAQGAPLPTRGAMRAAAFAPPIQSKGWAGGRMHVSPSLGRLLIWIWVLRAEGPSIDRVGNRRLPLSFLCAGERLCVWQMPKAWSPCCCSTGRMRTLRAFCAHVARMLRARCAHVARSRLQVGSPSHLGLPASAFHPGSCCWIQHKCLDERVSSCSCAWLCVHLSVFGLCMGPARLATRSSRSLSARRSSTPRMPRPKSASPRRPRI